MALEDYKDIVGSVAGVLTICQMFSGVFVCREIYKRGSANTFPPHPFVGPLTGGLLMFLQGLIVKDKTLGIVNFIGVALNLCYNAFYILYSDRANKIVYLKALARSLIIVVALTTYVQLEDPEKLEFRYGIIMICLMLYFLSQPLFSVKDIIRTKNSASIPFAMVFAGTLTSSSWLLYSYIINQPFLMFQNSLIFVLCGLQLALCLIYPAQTPKPEEKTE